AAGGSLTNWDLGVTNKALLGGSVFNDTNHNGRNDAGETGKARVKVFLDKNNNGKLDRGEQSISTNATGQFTFTAVAAGKYKLRIVVPAHFTVTTPRSGVISITLAAGQSVVSKVFGV